MFMTLTNVLLSELTTQQKLGWGTNGLVIGLGSVFTILIILIVVINLLKLSSSDKKKNKKVNKTEITPNKIQVSDEENEDEILAAIAAAINCMAQREGKRFAIKSYRRIGFRSKRSY